ncbi:MAG: CDC27 family protein [Blautia sp.]|nr:CDC27 family protein [Blautia sp.]
MVQTNTKENAPNPAVELDCWLESNLWKNKIQNWWFNNSLYQETDSNQIRTELKSFYAFIQIFYHDHFRESNAQIEQYLKALIGKVEQEEKYKTCQGQDKKLRDLVLGSAYRRLGQFRTERYLSADAEHEKAKYYLEQDTAYFELTNLENVIDQTEDFVIMFLFLLNKAKYFRDIAEKDPLRVDATYWRAIMLFQEIKKAIETLHDKKAPIDGILARIYASAWLNIAQIYRFQREYELAARECADLIGFCINSLDNAKEKNMVRHFVGQLPQMDYTNQIKGFSVKLFSQNDRNMVDHLFEDYILQALLQAGISCRDRVDFNGSLDGNFWVRRAVGVFLVLGIIDRIKDHEKDAPTEEIEHSLTDLLELEPNSMDVPQSLIGQIHDVCTKSETGNIALKNADAQNNLAVCLKKPNYHNASISILTGETLKGNKFAEYNQYKCYLESGLAEQAESITQYCYTPNQDSAYIYPDEPEKSNYKWLFLYARYLFTQEKYEEAEKLFSHIRSSRAIQWDSLELKAAYLEAQCQIKRGKYLAAIDSLTNIHKSLLKLDNERSKRQHEIRTEVDLGWCLIVEDRYKEALNVYIDLLTYLVQDEKTPIQIKATAEIDSPGELTANIHMALTQLKTIINSRLKPDTKITPPYTVKWHAVNSLVQKRILHNLYDCWTYLQIDSPETYSCEISDLIREICALNNNSDIYMQFLENLRNMNQIKRGFRQDDENAIREKWKNLSNSFGKILESRPMDYLTYSCWVISKVNYCMQFTKSSPEFIQQKRQLLLGLVSSTTPITMKSYIEVARIILAQEENLLDASKNIDYELERAFLELFCHVRLLENGTNQAFMKLMVNQSFHSIKLSTRAKLLATIVELYGDILRVKTQLRVTYANLADFENREPKDKTTNNAKPIICQYTRLSTLKGILPKTAGDAGEAGEPRFRMSNAARMNDASEGTMFKKICENIFSFDNSSDKSGTAINSQTYNEVIRKYIDNSAGYRDIDDISSFDSDVYIASFSMNKNNFGLWSNYADKEKGCIIGFDQTFFDLVDKNYYSILDDEAEENALYRIVYVDERQLSAGKEDCMFKSFKAEDTKGSSINDVNTIKTCIPNILQKLTRIETILLEEDNQIAPEAAGVVRAFIVDRLNEIRFLFKSANYEYEEEVRMLRCSQNPEVDNTASSPIPWLYINVEKKLDNLTLILGSKVELSQVRELSVWAKSTGRVKQVLWSGLNRL